MKKIINGMFLFLVTLVLASCGKPVKINAQHAVTTTIESLDYVYNELVNNLNNSLNNDREPSNENLYEGIVNISTDYPVLNTFQELLKDGWVAGVFEYFIAEVKENNDYQTTAKEDICYSYLSKHDDVRLKYGVLNDKPYMYLEQDIKEDDRVVNSDYYFYEINYNAKSKKVSGVTLSHLNLAYSGRKYYNLKINFDSQLINYTSFNWFDAPYSDIRENSKNPDFLKTYINNFHTLQTYYGDKFSINSASRVQLDIDDYAFYELPDTKDYANLIFEKVAAIDFADVSLPMQITADTVKVKEEIQHSLQYANNKYILTYDYDEDEVLQKANLKINKTKALVLEFLEEYELVLNQYIQSYKSFEKTTSDGNFSFRLSFDSTHAHITQLTDWLKASTLNYFVKPVKHDNTTYMIRNNKVIVLNETSDAFVYFELGKDNDGQFTYLEQTLPKEESDTTASNYVIKFEDGALLYDYIEFDINKYKILANESIVDNLFEHATIIEKAAVYTEAIVYIRYNQSNSSYASIYEEMLGDIGIVVEMPVIFDGVPNEDQEIHANYLFPNDKLPQILINMAKEQYKLFV